LNLGYLLPPSFYRWCFLLPLLSFRHMLSAAMGGWNCGIHALVAAPGARKGHAYAAHSFFGAIL